MDLEKIEVGEEFWDEDTGIKMLKFGEEKYAMVLDENGNVIQKPQEH